MNRISALLLAVAITLGMGPMLALADSLEPKHKVIIQVSSADEETQTLALNNARNLQDAFGMDDIAVEVVAYGPGLSLMTAGSPLRARVESMVQQNVVFSACENTIKNAEKKSGKRPVLADGVTVVPGGVAHIVKLQEQGYSYIRP